MNNFNGHGRIIFKKLVGESGVLKYTIAIKNKMKDKDDNIIPCVSFGKTAEIINQYFEVGDPIIITNGTLTSNKYEKEGKKMTMYEVVVNEFSFVIQKPKGKDDNTTLGNVNSGKLEQKSTERFNPKNVKPVENESDFDDDIPF